LNVCTSGRYSFVVVWQAIRYGERSQNNCWESFYFEYHKAERK